MFLFVILFFCYFILFISLIFFWFVVLFCLISLYCSHVTSHPFPWIFLQPPTSPAQLQSNSPRFSSTAGNHYRDSTAHYFTPPSSTLPWLLPIPLSYLRRVPARFNSPIHNDSNSSNQASANFNSIITLHHQLKPRQKAHLSSTYNYTLEHRNLCKSHHHGSLQFTIS